MASSIDLNGQIAIVTGGSRGIGAAIAVGLARSGADVTIADLPQRREDSSKTLALIEEAGGVGRALDVDVTDPDQIRNAVSQTVADKGRLDIMVNNAGVTVRCAALDLTPEQWDRLHNVNLRGVFFGCQAAAREMMKTGGGRIVNTASELAFVVPRSHISATYIASKHGVVGLTRSLAVEWAQQGIRVNAISPGPTNTDMMAPTINDPERLAVTVAEIPIGRMVEPQDLVGAVLFLASDLSAMVTGHVILVDGGRILV